MQTLYVQFVSAEANAAIVSYFAGPQDPEYWPNQGTVTTADPRWATYYNALPSYVQTGVPEPATV